MNVRLGWEENDLKWVWLVGVTKLALPLKLEDLRGASSLAARPLSQSMAEGS